MLHTRRRRNTLPCRSWPLALWVGASGLVVGGCGSEDSEPTVLNPSGCVKCHGGAEQDGEWRGIEKAHVDVEGGPLTCVDCHGGDPNTEDAIAAHVQPGTGAESELKDLTAQELDAVEPDYLRFVNPGDLRAAQRSCGSTSDRADGSGGCHEGVVDRVLRNVMSTFSGEMSIIRYRAGMQESGSPLFGISAVEDPGHADAAVPGTVASLAQIQDAEEPALGETAIGPYVDVYMSKSCQRCHLLSFGINNADGLYRSSGCTSCHMLYADDGHTESGDLKRDDESVPHPLRHELTSKIPVKQCAHCHFRGLRIGLSYRGFREQGGPGFDPANASRMEDGENGLYGRPKGFYIDDEDTTNDFDETPADVHFEAGMHCIDCHTEADNHGDGRIYADTSLPVEIECETCHGTPKAVSDFTTRRGRPMPNLSRDDDGKVWLTLKMDGGRLPVRQVKTALDEAGPDSYLHKVKGDYPSGFNHAERLECYTCHSAWLPTCYGCHITVDMSLSSESLTSGKVTPGKINGTRAYVAVDSFVLMENVKGRIAPSMPSEKMFVTAIDAEGNTVFENKLRTGAQGQSGHGQRPVQPHTIQRYTNFSGCRTCHPGPGFENQDQVYGTIGLGTGRFVHTDDDGVVHVLDQIVKEGTYESTVLVGHEGEHVARPLPADVIQRMLDVEVE